jgi:hypothetical protein
MQNFGVETSQKMIIWKSEKEMGDNIKLDAG